MKVLTAESTKCKGVRACEKICAKALYKSEDRALSAIQVSAKAGVFSFTMCNQCGECIKVCPTRALYRSKSGAVLVRKDLCVSCYVCVGFCPTNAMFWNQQQDLPIKCISCGQCVKACPHGVLSLVEQAHAQLPA
jgi:anaerobic carbon-monoxide dehydrogenase iron sulfur subunit